MQSYTFNGFHFRLESFYVNEFHQEIYRTSIGADILRKYSPNMNQTHQNEGHISFDLLIRYLQDGFNNIHTETFVNYCNPCQINYTYIAKLETHVADAGYIIRERLPGKGSELALQTPPRVTSKHLKMFQNLTSKQINFLVNRHEEEMEMFGYGFDRKTLTTECKYHTRDDISCC